MDTQMIEQKIAEFLAKGGKIKQYHSRADEIAANRIPTGKYFQAGAFFTELNRRKKQWAKKRNNQYMRQNPKISGMKPWCATAPGGGIEPGLPNNPRSNHKKIVVLRRAAISGEETRSITGTA